MSFAKKKLWMTPAIVAGLLILPPAMSSSSSPARRNKIVRTGVLDGWQVQSDGTVLLRLSGTRGEKAFSTWFETPATTTTATRFEHQVLAIVLYSTDATLPKPRLMPVGGTTPTPVRNELTVVGERTGDRLGRTPDDAFSLESISRNAGVEGRR